MKVGNNYPLDFGQLTGVAIDEEEALSLGWYQDSAGELYQYDGVVWIPMPETDNIKTLEYLG